jgi:bifunctional DNase/RNase
MSRWFGGSRPADRAPLVVVEVQRPVRKPGDSGDVAVVLLDRAAELAVIVPVEERDAATIAGVLDGTVPATPPACDIMRDLLRAMGVGLDRAEIVAAVDGVFRAELVLATGARVDARAADAIALALRMAAPVLCSAQVVALHGVDLVGAGAERDVAQFRDFILGVEPDDF